MVAAAEQVCGGEAHVVHRARLARPAPGADVGQVLERTGAHPLADDRARGLSSSPQPVYHVRFAAAELFGGGDHSVTVELWEDYLTPAEEQA